MASTTVRVDIDERGIKAYETDPETIAVLLEVGERIARVGAGLAARKTGAGSRSFHAEWRFLPEPSVHVSWDDMHFYMYFHEFGATHTPQQPALSVAIDIVTL